jgi:hypothetical protein
MRGLLLLTDDIVNFADSGFMIAFEPVKQRLC